MEKKIQKNTTEKEFARKVYSFDLKEVIDRTEQNHPYGIFDIDFKVPTAPNPLARDWNYAGSAKTLKEAVVFARKVLKEAGFDGIVRIVNAETGEVLKKIEGV